MKTYDFFVEKARSIVGDRPVELAEWAHEAKVTLIAKALHEAYNQGLTDATIKHLNDPFAVFHENAKALGFRPKGDDS